jgi:hypothetical protein
MPPRRDTYPQGDTRRRSWRKHGKGEASRSVIVQSRFTEKERDSLKLAAEQSEVTLSEYIRKTSLNRPLPVRSKQLDSLIFELNKIGVNLNQLTEIAHIGKKKGQSQMSQSLEASLHEVITVVKARLMEACLA